jgi:hypothetical protein
MPGERADREYRAAIPEDAHATDNTLHVRRGPPVGPMTCRNHAIIGSRIGMGGSFPIGERIPNGPWRWANLAGSSDDNAVFS